MIRLAKSLRDDDLSPAEYEMIETTREGAMLQHVIVPARLAISPRVPEARALVRPMPTR